PVASAKPSASAPIPNASLPERTTVGK
ncbi:MAG: hypothetical protein K0S65_6820, partial [Labilithrix sp.]|nr:hypothetical protein [Labilithrix sp.]